MLRSLEEVAALYRSCDIGLVFMHTKHPSYQPFEFMASGMATVSNINPATEWLLRDGENCLLTPPLPTPTAERLRRLVEDPELRARIAAAGLAEVGGTAGRIRSSGCGMPCACRTGRSRRSRLWGPAKQLLPA